MDDAARTRGEGLIPVYNAPDESTANIVKSVLEDAGVPAVVRSRQVAWLDSVLVPAEGRWGEVLVPAAEAERARAILAAYETCGDKETD